jgi:hypothetical protein
VDDENGAGGNLFRFIRMSEQHGTWVLPGYVAEELIGVGASGEVWRGRATDTGETVALKRLRAGAAELVRRRLAREAALLAAIDHPHLLAVRELVSTEQEAALVLDYAAGGSLAVLLRRRHRLRPGEVVTILAPLAAALAHAHEEGLVHGDVSPANVLFTAEGRPLLADLGVARALGDRDEAQCTPEYLDPAVARGAAVGPASDVFMVAAVAAHALTGSPPWTAGSAEQAIALAAAGEVPDLRRLLPEAPEPLIRAVQRALSAVPAERGSPAELALDMRHACPPEPVRLVWPAGTRPDRSGTRYAGARTHAVRILPAGPAATAEPRAPRHRRDDARPARSATGDPAGGPPGDPAGGPPARARPHRPSRWVGRAASAAAALLLAALVGVAWGSVQPAERSGDLAVSRPATSDATPPIAAAAATAISPPTATSGPTDLVPLGRGVRPRPERRIQAAAGRWLLVVAALDARRARAYERGDPALLAHVYVPGRHLSADVAQLRALISAGDTARGVRHWLGPARVLVTSTTHVRLRVVQSLPPSERLRHGRVVTAIPGTPPTAVLVDLVATPAGWRLA